MNEATVDDATKDEATVALADYKSSYRHLAWCFRRSRDTWKEKHQRLKREHKLLQNQLRAVTASREHHKQIARQASLDLDCLRLQADHLQLQLRDAQAELEKKGALPSSPIPGEAAHRALLLVRPDSLLPPVDSSRRRFPARVRLRLVPV